ncbi:GNAT family N-acetyltransferase [Phenylobacterium glaciei]
MTMLIVARDEHFAWLLGEAPPPDPLREAPGGVEQRRILRWLRAASARLEAAGCLGSWLIVDEGEVVGLCSFKGLPDAAGSAEIGYGIAETRRRNGHATEAVRLLCEEVGRVGGLRALRAETATDNPSSQRVLEHNGFVQVGARHDPEDGDLLLWSKPLGAWAGEPPSAPEADIANDR